MIPDPGCLYCWDYSGENPASGPLLTGCGQLGIVGSSLHHRVCDSVLNGFFFFDWNVLFLYRSYCSVVANAMVKALLKLFKHIFSLRKQR